MGKRQIAQLNSNRNHFVNTVYYHYRSSVSISVSFPGVKVSHFRDNNKRGNDLVQFSCNNLLILWRKRKWEYDVAIFYKRGALSLSSPVPYKWWISAWPVHRIGFLKIPNSSFSEVECSLGDLFKFRTPKTCILIIGERLKSTNCFAKSFNYSRSNERWNVTTERITFLFITITRAIYEFKIS